VETWPPGVYSIAKYELTPSGTGTRIVFDDTGFPPEDREALTANWPRFYWKPLRKYLEAHWSKVTSPVNHRASYGHPRDDARGDAGLDHRFAARELPIPQRET
jgi:hypothetical protein